LLLIIPINHKIAYADTPVVHAVLFYSQTCGYCHKVITEVLPPLVEKYGEQLPIICVDVTYEEGHNLYQAAIVRYEIPDHRYGVPTLIVGDTVLVGSGEIPAQFPVIIEDGLSDGGIDWPDIPGLHEILIAQGLDSSKDGSNEPIQEESATSTEALNDLSPSEEEVANIKNSQGEQSQSNVLSLNEQPVSFSSLLVYRFTSDLYGNILAVIVLLGMITSVIGVGYRYIKGSEKSKVKWPIWAIPVLSIIGLIAAIYLSYVEITSTEAFCGPVGNCNTVQDSPYAHLFGIIPIGVMGIAGYLTIIALWLVQQYGSKSYIKFSTVAIWSLAWFGVLFSIYLTFLEPFVIGATCAWCIGSAIVMTLILWATTETVIGL
ncbi:MAG: vitamin K epoxide reductase family protein, partial [Anaerolineales bacterium]